MAIGAPSLDRGILPGRRSIELETLASAFREALARNPANPRASFDFGVFLTRQRRLEEASLAFREVLRLAPKNEAAANNLLGILIQLGKEEEAIELRREMRRQGMQTDPRLEEQLPERISG